MGVWDAVARIVVVSIISIVLSILAMRTIKGMGIDIKDFKQRNRPIVLILAGLFNLLFILAVVIILKQWDHQPVGKLGFSLPVSDLLFALITLLFSLVLALFYVWYLHSVGVINISWIKHFSIDFKTIFAIILGYAVLFIAALQEEIMFRGYFSYVLLPFGFYYALIISSVIFTLWHFLTNKVNVFQTIDWLLGGIMLFYVFWLSGSIWVAAIIHFGRNLTNVLVFGITGTNSIVQYNKPLPSARKTIYTIFYSIFVVLVSYFYYNK